MTFLLPIALIAVGLAALVVTPQEAKILGLGHDDFARVTFGGALILWFLFMGVRGAGATRALRVIGGVTTWALLIFGLTGMYAYRYELSDVADRVIGEILPNEPQVGRGGEVILRQRMGGQFMVPAKVNDKSIAFVFDTGASTVVLRAEDARAIGADAAGLDFEVPVITANGSAMAAPTRIDRIAVGPIVVRNVRALVARPGALSESLLGMSFLERLDSYSVEHGRLVMKAK